MNWQFWRKPGAPIQAAPPARRRKTYSAESGYVYLYTFIEMRPEGEYCFEITADRRQHSICRVLLPGGVLARWEGVQQRKLTSQERYGIAKLAFFHALDRAPVPVADGSQFALDSSLLDEIADTLGLC